MTLRCAAAFVCVAALTGCAALGPAELPPAPAATPAAGAPVTAPRVSPVAAAAGAVAAGATGAAAAGAAGAAGAASAEMPPSPEALAVLASIPEPVPGQVTSGRGNPSAARAPRFTTPAPAASAPVSAPVTAPQATPDAPARSAAGDSATAAPDTASIPVPAPTTPLGAESHAMPATPAPPVVAPPPVPIASIAPGVLPPVVSTAAGPDTCWRVQLGAPSERARGRVLRDASQSLLLAPMTLMNDAGRWKVRTRDCLSRAAAESLRDRAADSGFKGVFLVRFVERR